MKARAITASKAAKARANCEASTMCIAKNQAQGRMEEIIRSLNEGNLPDNSVKPGQQDGEGISPIHPHPHPRLAH